jgi:hypothetical protein
MNGYKIRQPHRTVDDIDRPQVAFRFRKLHAVPQSLKRRRASVDREQDPLWGARQLFLVRRRHDQQGASGMYCQRLGHCAFDPAQ